MVMPPRGILKVDTRISDHPDVYAIPSRLRLQAMGAWTMFGSWCASNDHTGFVPSSVARRYGTKRAVDALVSVGLLDSWPDLDGYVLTHGRHNAYDLWAIERLDYRRKIPDHVRALVYRRDGYACVVCSATAALSLDHIKPWSLGGSDDPSNLQTLCRPCNSRKGARV